MSPLSSPWPINCWNWGMQQNLFNDREPPSQIKLIPDFLTEDEEQVFLKHFQSIQWQKIQMHGVIAKRRVAHFGLDYAYTKRAVQKTIDAPSWLDPLTSRVAEILNKPFEDLQEILVTFYPSGSGIGWHKDAEVFGDSIAGVSFLSDCEMKFKHPETDEVFKLFIPRRSAYIFSNEARWKWHHSIANHKTDRYSVTYRTLR